MPSQIIGGPGGFTLFPVNDDSIAAPPVGGIYKASVAPPPSVADPDLFHISHSNAPSPPPAAATPIPEPAAPTTTTTATSSDTVEPPLLQELEITPDMLQVTNRYPLTDYPDLPLESDWAAFAFPQNDSLKIFSNNQQRKFHFGVITSGTKQRTIKLYAAFLT